MKRLVKFILLLMVMAAMTLVAIGVKSVCAENEEATQFKRISPQWIAALGDPDATSGTGAQLWGLWRRDPGPRGVSLDQCFLLKTKDGVAPAGWKYDDKDWWMEEHGLIMEKPEFPLPPGKYVVTGGRVMTAILTVHPPDKDGAQHWELNNGAKLHDVTHLPCRSARYQSVTNYSCSPDNADKVAFPVSPGASMPEVNGCQKQDYAVLIVTGVAAEN